MAKNEGLIKTISNASFLLVLIGAFLFLYAWSFTQGSKLFGGLEDFFFRLYTVYAFGFAVTLTGISIYNPQIVKKLAKANFWKAFLMSFLPSAIFTVAFLFLIKVIITSPTSINVFEGLRNIPILIFLTHLIVVTQMEELMFGALIYPAIEQRSNKRNANIITSILFPLWHIAKTGGQFILTIMYVPLRIWWNYVRNNGTPGLKRVPFVKNFFKATPTTQQANAGSHLGWNVFVTAFVQPVGL